jgi:hypothetical protein
MSLNSPTFPGWNITIDGLVENPMTLDVRDLINLMQVEQRVYRHRQVNVLCPLQGGFPVLVQCTVCLIRFIVDFELLTGV